MESPLQAIEKVYDAAQEQERIKLDIQDMDAVDAARRKDESIFETAGKYWGFPLAPNDARAKLIVNMTQKLSGDNPDIYPAVVSRLQAMMGRPVAHRWAGGPSNNIAAVHRFLLAMGDLIAPSDTPNPNAFLHSL